MSDGVRKEINKFFKVQSDTHDVKRREQALSLFHRGYSEQQVGDVLGFHAKTAHACKFSFTKQGKVKQEIRNYLKGDFKEFMNVVGKINTLVGFPAHSKKAEVEKKRAKRARQAEASA